MRGQLGGAAMTPDEEPEPEIWSPETLRRRSEQLQSMGVRAESRCEELELSDTERSRSQTSSDSQVRQHGAVKKYPEVFDIDGSVLYELVPPGQSVTVQVL
jgi:hypothetical protein